MKLSNTNELMKKPVCILKLDILDLSQIENRLNVQDMDFMRNPLLSSYVHPNCLAFDDSGRLFVGDSIGLIRCWDVSIFKGDVRATNEFIIKHDELDDDPISQITVDQKQQNRLFVHSKDNCIRIIEYDMDRRIDPKIRQRFFGAKNKTINVRSCVSPDSTFVASGSETGQPYVWNALTNELFSDQYECKFLDTICDVDWNPRFNMIALSGFGHSYPVMVYVYEKTRKEVDFSLGRNYIDEEEDLEMEEKQRKEMVRNSRMSQSSKFGTFKAQDFGSPSQGSPDRFGSSMSRMSNLSSPIRPPMFQSFNT